MLKMFTPKSSPLVLLAIFGLLGIANTATYNGHSAWDAGQVLDASQAVRGWRFGARGHPRGHASHPGETTPEGSVENYSAQSTSLADAKSAFESRSMQNVVAHAALSSGLARQAYGRLNAGSARETVQVPWSMMEGLPSVRMAKWVQGRQRTNWSQPRSVTLVLQHHQGQQNNPNADVHVHTFYPRGR